MAGPVERVAQGVPQTVELRALLHAEHRTHDHLERDRLHPRPQPQRLPVRPAPGLPLCHLAHHVDVALHALPVERGQEKLALRHVLLFVEEQDRVGADHRTQDRVRLARMENLGVAGEDLAHVLRVGEHHPGAFLRDAHAEDVAVALVATLEEGAGPRDPSDRLDCPRHAVRGEAAAGSLPSPPSLPAY